MRSGQLLFKIYLGCVVTVILAIALSFSYGAYFRSARDLEGGRLFEHLVNEIAERRNDPEALRREIGRFKRRIRTSITVYSPDGNLIASTADPPPPMVSDSDYAKLVAEGHVRINSMLSAYTATEGGHIVAVGIIGHRPPPLDRAMAPLGTYLVLLMVVAVVFARHLAKPLKGIANAAERFGHGELSARTGVHRNDEIGVAARAFDEMADRVTWLMTAQQELLANVSHELRTPISRIHVAVDLLMDGVSTQVKELLPEIAHDLAELERLIDDVMVVAKLDLSRSGDRSAGMPLRLESLVVDELIQKAATRFRSQHQTHELVVELSPGLPPLSGDAVLLRRVIENLLDNARKYSEPGSVIRVTASPYSEPGPGGVRVAVSDFGIGMEAADLKLVFTPFFRSDRSRSRATGGVGLGLVLARRVVEAHNGTIEIESTPGEGTTVTVSLPATQPRHTS